MMPLRAPARRVIMRALLFSFLRTIAENLGIPFADARKLAQSVLADDEDPHNEDGNSARVL
jgi:hypothetical protein